MKGKKNENESCETKEMKKWTEGAVVGIYSTVLPTTNLNNIIFNYSIGDMLKIHQ
jgi:hypothetical protein